MSSRFILQDQKIPEIQKTKEWDISHVESFLMFSTTRTDNSRKAEQLKCWSYYLGNADKAKEASNRVTTQPYGYSLGLEYTHYPLIESKIEQMVGEYLTRPIKKKTYVLNKRAKSKKMDDLFAMVSEEILRDVNKELEPALGFIPSTENPEKELPEDIEEFFENGDFKTESEEVSDIILEQVLEVKNNKNRIKDLLVDALVQDECIALIDKEDGHPAIQRRNIFDCTIDLDPEKEIQKDPQYFIHSKFYAYNELINSYDLKKEEEEILKSYSNFSKGGYNSGMQDFAGDGFDAGSFDRNLWFSDSDNIMRIRLVEMIWISKKQVRAKVSVNKVTGKEIYKLLPPDYVTKKNDSVKSIWVDYKRKILMAGPNLVLEHGPVNERYSRIDDPKKDTINVVAFRRNNFLNANIRSMASKLFQLQDFASETLFEIRLAMRRSNGRVLVYDSAQIPKQFLKTGGYKNALNRVMHHAKKDQFLIINSQDKNSRYAFNQFTSLDLSTRGLLQDLFNTLALIEDLASKFVGLPPQREGQVEQYATVQGTERAVAQSTARTEIYTGPFDNFLEAILEKVLLKAKHVYEENETVEYLFGNLKQKFFKVYPSFFQDDIGVSIGNNFKENKNKNIIDSAAQQVFGNAQTPEMILTLIEVLNTENASESEKILRRGMKALDLLRQENNKAMQEAAQTTAAAEKERQDAEHDVKREGFKKDIKVAEIQANASIVKNNESIKSAKGIALAQIEKEYLAKEKSN